MSNPLKPFKCRNRNCERGIALTDGARLYVAKMAVISERSVYTCAHCNFYSRWIRLDVPAGDLDQDMATPPNPFEHNELLGPLPCPHCGETVALTDGIRVYASGMVFATRMIYICLHCGQVASWKPPLGPVKVQPPDLHSSTRANLPGQRLAQK